jgi:spore germination protein
MDKLQTGQGPSKQTISAYQAFSLVFSTLYGVGVLSLPRDVAEASGNDMVWVIVAAGIVVGIFIMIISVLCRRFPKLTLVQFVPLILGSDKRKKLGLILSIPIFFALAGFWVFGISISVRVFGEAVVNAVLLRTPIEAVMMILLLSSAIGAGSELGIIAKFNEFLLPFNFIPFFIMVIALYQHGKVPNLLPLFEINWPMFLKAVLTATFSYAGFKVMLMFSGYYQDPQKTFKAHLYAIVAVIFSYWYLCLTALSVFGKDELNRVLYPVLEVVKNVEVRGVLFERLESAILALWLIAVFTTVLNLHAALVEMVMQLFRLEGRYRRWIAFAFSPLLFGLGLIPKNMEELAVIANWVGIYEFSLSIAFVFLTIVAVIRKKKGEVPDETETISSQ